MTSKPTEAVKGKSYGKEFHCNNCGYDYWDYFEFGNVARQGVCPLCGVTPSQLKEPSLD